MIALLLAASLVPVVRAVDGDTVVLRGIGTARLIGIDTPETKHPRKPVQTCGPEASAKLRELLTGQYPDAYASVRVTYGPQRRDKYRRSLVYLWRGRTLVNLELIHAGLARAERRYPHPRMSEFVRAEYEATKARRGLWAETPCEGDR